MEHATLATTPFLNLYRHGFVRLATAVPRCRIADPLFNGEASLKLLQQAAAQGASVVVFPELGLSAYSCDDLFHQHALLDGCEEALARLVLASEDCPALAVVGMPIRVDHSLFNCAVVVHAGAILGVVPKTYLPNYGEYYEGRQFNPGHTALSRSITLCGQQVPFGAELLFQARNLPQLVLHAEICEDLWVPVPPSSMAALAGATVLLNLSASNVTVGKSGYRHQLASSQSARCLAAYVYASAGPGESTTDLAWDGQALIYENGQMLAQSERFGQDAHVLTADVDLERLVHDRVRQTSFGQSAARYKDILAGFRTVHFDLELPLEGPLPLQRVVERFPYVPAQASQRDQRCREVYSIQVQALCQRLSSSGIQKLVIGISGGLDSTHALLVCAEAMDRLGLPRTNILGITMPGFATSTRTRDQAMRLMQSVGCDAREIDIRPSCIQMLKDLDHPYADGQAQYDITFENVQAGERTSHLFRLANFHDGIVVGTGDLSELALGWCTYGVGDHMSHYNVNASVPKTLIQHLVRWVAETGARGPGHSQVLLDILGTEISPELIPGASDTEPGQSTESKLGPYELHDFSLYYTVRFGLSPAKVAFLAYSAWHSVDAGPWPEAEHVQRRSYTLAEIKRHMRTFLYRFFKTSQFKRSCVPNAPKVGSGGSLSPRGDWRAPSDSEATVWLANLDRIPENAEG